MRLLRKGQYNGMVLILAFVLGLGMPVQGQEDANRPATKTVGTEEPSHSHAVKTNKYLSRQVWQSRIRAPKTTARADYTDLSALIEKIRTVKVNTNTPESPTQEEPNRSSTPVAETQASLVTPPIPVKGTAPATSVSGRLTTETLTQIQRVPPEVLPGTQALQLADLLYQSQYSETAAPYYRRAIEQIDPNTSHARENRAWALFQLGNCLRESHPGDAKLAYQRLKTEFPQSSWNDMAVMWHELADWYWREVPLQTLEQATRLQSGDLDESNPLNGES